VADQLVPELDVIIAVAKWLHSGGWQIEEVSMPRGQGIDQIRNRDKLETEFAEVGISTRNIKFKFRGEDIRTRKGGKLWRIECKGLTSGRAQTVKNNFDRAVASAVSYYTQREELQLGLALPEGYNKFLRERIPLALRTTINLWIFLYVAREEVLVFAPDEEILLEE